MKYVQFFDTDYNDEMDEFFDTVAEAIDHAMHNLSSGDFPYMIGYPDERGIVAFVFQGKAYFSRKLPGRTL